jgi:hypothetical protein
MHLPKGSWFGLAGAAFLLLAGWLLSNQFVFLYRAQRASATVVALEADPSNHKQNAVLFPVVQFTTPQGQAVTAQSTMGNYPPRYEVGQRVTVWYNPARPERMKVVSFFDQLFESVAALGLGLVGAFLLFVARQPRDP